MAQEIFLKDNVNAQAQRNRDYEYQTIAQPLFMKVQMGRATQEEFQAVMNGIDAKYPFVTEDLVIDTDDVPSININQGA